MLNLGKDPLPLNYHGLPARAMMFIDGENLAIRFAAMPGATPRQPHVELHENVYVWSKFANMANRPNCEILRRFYYTAVQGASEKLETVSDSLKNLGIEAPRVFQKEKGKRSKRVDIQLATDMLGHAHRGNYDVAILVAGDEDYVPLVEAVQREGKRVGIWFVPNGLSEALLRAADFSFDLTNVFFKDESAARIHYA